MGNKAIWTLLVLVMISALMLVGLRHQHRIAYAEYHQLSVDRDSLNDEWGQLLIEENLWSSAHRVEKHAGERLSLRAPNADEVQVVRMGVEGMESVVEVQHGTN